MGFRVSSVERDVAKAIIDRSLIAGPKTLEALAHEVASETGLFPHLGLGVVHSVYADRFGVKYMFDDQRRITLDVSDDG